MGDYSQEYNATGLSMDIQMESSSEKLESYLNNNKKLEGGQITYLEARTEAAKHFEKLKANKSTNKKEPELIQQDKKTILKLSKQRNQTADNGCWSVALSMMLESRGVELPQEVIRAYRSPYAKWKEDKSGSIQNNYTKKDQAVSIGERADLIADVLPNTLLHIRQYPVGERFYSQDTKISGKPFEKNYLKKAADVLFEDIRSAITEKKSPLSLTISGHVWTVIGVDENNKILFKDSKGSPPDATRSCSAQDIVDFAEKRLKAGGSNAIELGWLEDIKKEDGVILGDRKLEYQKGNKEEWAFQEAEDTKGQTGNVRIVENVLSEKNDVMYGETVYLPEKLVEIKPYKKIDPPKVTKSKAERFWNKDHKEHDLGDYFTDMPKIEPKKNVQNPKEKEVKKPEGDNMPKEKPEEKKEEEKKPEEKKEEEKKPEEKKEEEKKPEEKKENPEVKQNNPQQPGMQMPQVQMPQVQMPQVQKPQPQMPQAQMPQAQMPQAQTPQAQTPQAQMPQAQMPQAQKPAEEKASDAESTLAMQKKELEKMILNKPEQPERPSLWDYIKDWFGIGGKRNEKCVKWEEYKKELKKWKKDIREKGAQLHNDEMKEMVRKGMQQGNYASQMQETQKEGPTLSSYAGIQNDSKADVVPAEKTTTTPLQQTETEKEPLPDEKELEEQSKKEVDDLLKKLKDANGGDLPDEVVKNVKNLSDGARQGQLKIQEQIKEHENVSDPKKRYFSAGVDFQKIIAYESFKSAVMDGKANETLLNQMKDEKFYVKWQAMALTSKDVQHYNGINGIKHTPDDYRRALSKQSKETMADGLNQELVERAVKYHKEKALWLCQSNDKKIEEIKPEKTEKPKYLKEMEEQDVELETFVKNIMKNKQKTKQKTNEKKQQINEKKQQVPMKEDIIMT